MEKKKTGFRNLPVNVWIVTATSFLTDVSSERIVTLIPLFLATLLRAGTEVIGLIECLFPAGVFQHVREDRLFQSPNPLRRQSRQILPGTVL
jgi:hypothetical protein